MELILFCLALIGGVYIVCKSDIMTEFRKSVNEDIDPRENIPTTFMGRLIACPRCTAFWISIPIGFFTFTSAWWVVTPLIAVGVIDLWVSLVEMFEDYLKCHLM